MSNEPYDLPSDIANACVALENKLKKHGIPDAVISIVDGETVSCSFFDEQKRHTFIHTSPTGTWEQWW